MESQQDYTTNEPASKSAGQLLLLFLSTSTLLLIAGCVLSQSIPATMTAVRLWGFLFVLSLATALSWRVTKSLTASILILALYLALVQWLGKGWLLIPLIVAAIVFLFSCRPIVTLRMVFQSGLWIRSGLAAGLILSVTHYGDFLILDKLRQALLHRDTLFHASIASMIKTYGAASLGLHGIVEHHYHVLSHRLFAVLSTLSGVPVLEIYGFLPILLLGPLLVTATTWCASRLSGTESAEGVDRNWLVVCAVLALLKALPLEIWAVWDDYFVSESYNLSLVLFMLALPSIVTPKTSLLKLAGAGVLLLLAGLSKGSVGVFGLGLLWLRAILCPGVIGRVRVAAVTIVVTIVFVYMMSGPAQAASARTSINSFYHVQRYSAWGNELGSFLTGMGAGQIPEIVVLIKAVVAMGAFLIFNYLLSWFIVLRRIVISGPRCILSQPDSLYTLAALGISVSTLFFAISGGEWYFINPPMFVSLPFLVIAVTEGLGRWPRLATRSLVAITVLGLSVTMALSHRNVTGVFAKTAFGLDPRRIEITDNTNLLLELRTRESVGPVMFVRGEDFPMANPYWPCVQAPLLYPAVTEQAWIGVIDPKLDCTYQNFAYIKYIDTPSRNLVSPVVPTGVRIVTISNQ